MHCITIEQKIIIVLKKVSCFYHILYSFCLLFFFPKPFHDYFGNKLYSNYFFLVFKYNFFFTIFISFQILQEALNETTISVKIIYVFISFGSGKLG